MISTNFFKINIFIPWNRYTFLEINVLHANRYLYNLNQVYISGKTTTSSKIRTSSKLIFWSRETGIHFRNSTYIIKIDIFITWNVYTILEINVLDENRYLYNSNLVYITEKTTTSPKLIFSSRETGIYLLISTKFFKINILIPWNRYTFLEITILHQNWYLYNLNTFLEKQRLHQNWYFHNVKQVYIFWYQRTSSKLIILSHETGIHFWKSTYFMQIDICITWIRYTFLEKQRLHQNWYFYDLKRVYNFGNQHTSPKLIFLIPETCIHFWKSTYFFKINILIPWNRYSFLEFNVLHQIRYFYNLKQVYNSGNQRTSWK